MRSKNARILCWAATIAAAGMFLPAGGCAIGDVAGFVKDFNPCGTILACDPVQYRFLTSGYEGPGIDPEIDPVCTYPPYCVGDPFVSSNP